MLKLLKNITFLILFCAFSSLATAQESRNNVETLSQIDHFFLMDQETGEVLLSKNADIRVAPSSMTKLMTAYVVFSEIKKGRIQLGNQCLIGKSAWGKQGSSMFLNYRDVVSVDELLGGLIIDSGNDSAIALAESVAGSVPSFAKLMNKTAKEIGLKNSHFQNPHGLNEDGHYVTLRDLATLARRIALDFPEFMHYFSTKDFTYSNITQHNRNPLIKYSYAGATGMKTGYTNDGGYGVVGTATRGNQKLIGVVNKTANPKQRSASIMELLDYGFSNFQNIIAFDKDDTVATANVWLGTKDKVDMVTKDKIVLTTRNGLGPDDVKFQVTYDDPIFSPIKKDQQIGKLVIKVQNDRREIPLYAKESVEKAPYLVRMFRIMHYKLTNL